MKHRTQSRQPTFGIERGTFRIRSGRGHMQPERPTQISKRTGKELMYKRVRRRNKEWQSKSNEKSRKKFISYMAPELAV